MSRANPPSESFRPTRVHRWKFHAPHEGQREARELIRKPEARVVVLGFGRRWGKTTMVEAALEDVIAGQKVIWSSHRYAAVDVAWRYAMECVPATAVVKKREKDHYLQLNTGGSLQMFSLDDPDSAIGYSARYHYLDEAARMSKEARDQTAPATVADYNGTIVVMTTPRGKKGRAAWVHRDVMKAKAGEPGFFYRSGPSWENPKPEIREWCAWYEKNVDVQTYRQEILAEFLDEAASVISLDSVCTLGGTFSQPVMLPYAAPWDGEETCVAGLDLGDSQNFTVLTIIGKKSGRMLAADRFQHMGWFPQVSRLSKTFERFCKPSVPSANPWEPPAPPRTLHVFTDVTGLGAPVVEMLHQAAAGKPISIVPIMFDNDEKQGMIDSLKFAIEQNQISMPYLREYVEEADALSEDLLPSGVHRYAAPEGYHDDCVWSLALAVRGRRRVISDD